MLGYYVYNDNLNVDMSGTWSGFSEEDIKKLKSRGSKGKEIKKPISTSENNVNKIPMNDNKKSETKIEEIKKDVTVMEPINTIIEHSNNEEKELQITEGRHIKLDEFEAKQKLIEEQNRKKKEILSKALEDRTKKTEEEARILKEIKADFKKLDALLSNDVSVLRHQIDIASMDFMEAQKRFDRLEKDFLEAKLYLHSKRERKEMLTEHLCTIIEKNEERKAEKLSELMCRLEMNNGAREIIPIIENNN